MESVPLDVWKKYFPLHLDPRDIARVSAICRRFSCFQQFIHKNYKMNVNKAFIQACCEGRLELARWLIDTKGATLDNEKHWLIKALCCACKHGHLRLVQWLIDVKGVDEIEFALFYAIGHQSIVNWLHQREMQNNIRWIGRLI